MSALNSRLNTIVDFGKMLLVIVGVVWAMVTFSWSYVGKPKAQELIITTVQATVADLQKQLADLRLAVEEGRATDAEAQAALEALKAQIEMLQHSAEQAQSDNQQIIQLLESRLPAQLP